jgi:hypothetical protein
MMTVEMNMHTMVDWAEKTKDCSLPLILCFFSAREIILGSRSLMLV